MTRTGPDDERLRSRPSDPEEFGDRWHEWPIKCRRIADPRLRRLVLARIDAQLAARGPKPG